MFTKIGLPLLAIGMLLFAVQHVRTSLKSMPKLPPPIEPARNPFPNTVAGAGMIEPQTESIAMGSPVPGVVVEVPVKVGQQVMAGEALFRLDDRQLQAELARNRAQAKSALAELTRLENEPRPEKLQMTEAQLAEAEARLADTRDRWNRSRKTSDQKIFSDEEVFGREQAFRAAEALVLRAKAELEMTKSGVWEFDKAVARAALEEAETRAQQTETELKRLVIRALVDGEVLQVNVRPGEFVAAPAPQALILLGNVQQLHVRVDIDEYDIPRFSKTAAARASLKGQPGRELPLRFIRVEPFVVPKKSLTGDNTERVDTRVLQVIYAIDADDQQLFVGQQLDVFVQADEVKPVSAKN